MGNNGLYNQIPETYPLVHSPPFLLINGNMRIHMYCSSEEKKTQTREQNVYCAGIVKQSIGARNRLGIHSLAELVPWKRFMGSLKV